MFPFMKKFLCDHYLNAACKWSILGTAFALAAISAFVQGCSTPAQQLRASVDRGEAPRVAQLLKNPQNLRELDPLLVRAALKGETAIVSQLLDAGAKFASGEALSGAAKAGSFDTVKLLLDRGADVDKQGPAIVIRDSSLVSNNGQTTATFRVEKQDGAGNNALSSAIIAKHVQVVRLLLERKADRTRTVVYQDAAMASGFPIDIFPMALSGGQVNVNLGSGLFVSANGGRVTTNIRFETEKSASMQELAKFSADKEIIALLP